MGLESLSAWPRFSEWECALESQTHQLYNIIYLGTIPSSYRENCIACLAFVIYRTKTPGHGKITWMTVWCGNCGPGMKWLVISQITFTRFRSNFWPVENLHSIYCLHGTVSFFAKKYLSFTRNRLFWDRIESPRSFVSHLPRELGQTGVVQPGSLVAWSKSFYKDQKFDSDNSVFGQQYYW